MSIELLEKVVSLLIREQIRVKEVTLSGGEPTMHPQMLDLVSVVSTLAPDVTMVSNGTLLTHDLIDGLIGVGLTKLRLGIDSLDPLRPRPSRPPATPGLGPHGIIRLCKQKGLDVDMNVVVSRFNKRELSSIISFVLEHGVDAKFFEHVEVVNYGQGETTGTMLAVPHVPLGQFVSSIERATGYQVKLEQVGEFGDANIATTVDGVELRYCRYLCPYALCWITGTRIDPMGFAYNCMVSRGRYRISNLMPENELLDIVQRASYAACPTSSV